MVVERFQQLSRAPCAPTRPGDVRWGGGPGDANWTCLKNNDVEQLRRWLKEAGLNPDPLSHTPHCNAKDDACVLDGLSKKGVSLARDLAKTKLAPPKPAKWKKEPNAWLTTPEFGQVMRQYEAIYPEFEFLGASPIDFDKPLGNSCVWPRICGFSIAKAKAKGKTKIGFVFNEDKHTEEGSHWICAFLDIPNDTFYYIDSVANETPKEIKELAERLQKEHKEVHGRTLKFRESTMPHQRGDNQCGMYCLFFIISLLTEIATYDELMRDRIPDGAMAGLRNHIFGKVRSTEKQYSLGRTTKKGGRRRTRLRSRRAGRTRRPRMNKRQCKRRTRGHRYPSRRWRSKQTRRRRQ
jgi:hypothetical protein